MSLQNLFEKHENVAVAVFVTLLVVAHYVLLRLIEAS
jgi:hypothetical protein